MPENFIEEKKKLEKETKEIESTIIPQYKKKIEETESKLSFVMSEFEEMNEEIEMHRKTWQEEVDNIFNNVGSLITSLKHNILAALNSRQSKLESQIPNMIQAVKESEGILASNNVSAVASYQSKLEEYWNIPADLDVKLPSLKINTLQGKELSLELDNYKASMTQLTLSSLTEELASSLSLEGLLEQVKPIATIPSRVLPLHHVACVGMDEVWVSGDDKTVRCVDVHGSLRDTVNTTCQTRPIMTSQ
jgi:hypothetical protein